MRLIDHKREIMALPEEDRLPFAIELIEDLTGSVDHNLIEMRRKWGLTLSEARIVGILNSRPGKTVSEEAIYKSLYGYLGEVDLNTIKVFISKIRRKVPFKIINERSVGFYIEEAVL